MKAEDLQIRTWLVSLQTMSAEGAVDFRSHYMYRFDDKRLHPADIDALVNLLIDRDVLRSACVLAISSLEPIGFSELPDSIRDNLLTSAIQQGIIDAPDQVTQKNDEQ